MQGPAGVTAGTALPQQPTGGRRGAAMGRGESKGKKGRQPGMGRGRTLGSGRKLWGTRGLRSGPSHLPPSLRPISRCSPRSPRSTPRFRPPLRPLPPPPLWPCGRLLPPHALLPPAPDAEIARRYEDFGNRTGGVVTRWLLTGGSVPRGKFPRSPRAVVGYGISRPLFRHLPQQ